MKFTEEVVDRINNYIISNISKNPNKITQQTCDHFQITKPTVLKYINELVKAGIIEKHQPVNAPHIVLENGEPLKDCDILLDISIEKSSLGAVSREKIETSESKVNSNVMIKNGQTLILGGLFQYTKSDSTGGIPLLKDIPLIGLFFQTKNSALMKNELLFFITPRVITPGMVNKMQDHSYMSYKKNLEYHKENLTQKLNEADDTGVEEEKAEAKKEEKPKKEEKAEKELTPLEMLAGKGEEEF